MINPDAGNLGAKVGFVFAGLGVPLCILFYFFIPETKGLGFNEVSLIQIGHHRPPNKVLLTKNTQMDYLFNNHVSCRRFQSAIKEHRMRDGGLLVLAINGETLKTEVPNVMEVEAVEPASA